MLCAVCAGQPASSRCHLLSDKGALGPHWASDAHAFACNLLPWALRSRPGAVTSVTALMAADCVAAAMLVPTVTTSVMRHVVLRAAGVTVETRVPVSGALMEPARPPACTRVCAQPGALTTLGGCVPTVGSSHTG